MMQLSRELAFRHLIAFLVTGAGTALLAQSASATPAMQSAAGGVVTTIAEVAGGTGGMEVGKDGVIYSSDFGVTLSNGPAGTRIFRVTPAGQVSVFAEGLRGASGSTFDAVGNFLQSNVAGNTITLIQPDGQRREVVSQGLKSPVGITPGSTGEFFVANCGSNSVQRVKVDGTSEVFSTDTLLNCPNGIVSTPDGNLYVSNFYNGDVVRVRPDGPALSASLSLPNDLALRPDGNTLYFNEVKPLDDPTSQVLAPTLVRALRLR